MFRYMIDVFAWGVVLSFIVFGLAFLAEGRGAHLLKILTGRHDETGSVDALADVPREEHDWHIVGALSDDRHERAEARRAAAEHAELRAAVLGPDAVLGASEDATADRGTREISPAPTSVYATVRARAAAFAASRETTSA